MLEVLVVHRPRYDDWSFPKGKRDDGETDLECALRETAEESGALVDPHGELTPITYDLSSGKTKQVRFWFAELLSGDFEANDEVDQIRWLSVREAVELLSYDRDKQLLDEFSNLVN